jgi:hypothetical protein
MAVIKEVVIELLILIGAIRSNEVVIFGSKNAGGLISQIPCRFPIANQLLDEPVICRCLS